MGFDQYYACVVEVNIDLMKQVSTFVPIPGYSSYLIVYHASLIQQTGSFCRINFPNVQKWNEIGLKCQIDKSVENVFLIIKLTCCL